MPLYAAGEFSIHYFSFDRIDSERQAEDSERRQTGLRQAKEGQQENYQLFHVEKSVHAANAAFYLSPCCSAWSCRVREE